MKISDTFALVTGASAGIGAATARELARRGAKVALVARTGSRLAEIAEKIEAMGGAPAVYPADLADPGEVTLVAERIAHEHGTPDILVNNAGAGRWLAVDETPPEEMVTMMQAPTFAAFFVTRAFLPQMIARRSGHVLNVNSPASFVVFPGAAGYSTARWALRGFTEALRADVRGTAIGVTHFVVGNVSSTYFTNNPGSEERVPAISRLLPVLTPHETARMAADAIERNRKEVFVPGLLHALMWVNRLAPGLVRWLTWRSGWQRPPTPRSPHHGGPADV